MSSDYVKLRKSVEQKINRLEIKIAKMDIERRDIKRQIDQLRCGLCPISPGDIIYWESGTRMRRGKVISVQVSYQDHYEFRVHLLNKKGDPTGYATVNTKQMPTKEPPK